MLEKILTGLGLGDKEILVYKLILEYGKIAPALLSRKASINRTTIYSVAKELKEKGLILEDLGGKIIYYLPVRGNELEIIIKKEQEYLKQKENSIHELQQILQNTPESKTYSVPKIRFIDESDIKTYLHEAAQRWNESIVVSEETTWWGFQDHTFVEYFEDWIRWYWKEAPEQINLKLFSNDSSIEEHMSEEKINRRDIRFWKGEEKFTATQWVIGSYIVMIMTAQKPFYLVEIHDSVLANNMRTLFKHMWKE